MREPYLWLKALHVAAAFTFVGGVLAVAMLLPLVQSLGVSPQDRCSVVHGLHRWQRLVTTPAMFIVWALGLTLALRGGWFAYAWLQAKLVLVMILSGLHGMQSGLLRRLAGGSVLRSRWSGSGVPLTIGLVTGIAILVVVLR